MPVNEETRRTLNMLRDQPAKAIEVLARRNSFRITEPERIVPHSGIYWLYGTTELATGVELESVFSVDTGSPRSREAKLKTYFWWIEDNWYPQGDERALRRLEISEDEAFPFRWTTVVEMAVRVPGGATYKGTG